MTPPSDNIEFLESEHFKKALAPAPQVREAIIGHLQSWPATGVEFGRNVREFKLKIGAAEYAVIYRRTANKLGLMHVYQLPFDEAELVETRAELIKLFGKK
jgi:hypothetical protein